MDQQHCKVQSKKAFIGKLHYFLHQNWSYALIGGGQKGASSLDCWLSQIVLNKSDVNWWKEAKMKIKYVTNKLRINLIIMSIIAHTTDTKLIRGHFFPPAGLEKLASANPNDVLQRVWAFSRGRGVALAPKHMWKDTSCHTAIVHLTWFL